MNVTTGTILCNARYKKINGYDCFVNMEDNFNSPKTQNNFDLRETSAFPAIANISSTTSIDGSNSRISPKVLRIQNTYFSYIIYTDKWTQDSTTTDWTLAFWGKYESLNPPNVRMSISVGYLDIGQFRDPVTTAAIYYEKKPDGLYMITGQSVPANTWTHFMYTKKGNNLYLFRNGTLIKTDTTQSGFYITNTFGMRAYHCISYYDDIVLVQGEALATSSFTVPTNDYLLSKSYDNIRLGPNNIVYPMTVAQANTIFSNKEKIKIY